jgi:hypothetical protein
MQVAPLENVGSGQNADFMQSPCFWRLNERLSSTATQNLFNRGPISENIYPLVPAFIDNFYFPFLLAEKISQSAVS